MEHSKLKFDRLISDIRQIMTIYDYMTLEVKIPLDTSDLLRWQLVQAVSAFDKFIHDIVRVGMIEIFNNKRLKTSKYNNFQISFMDFLTISQSLNPTDEFEKLILYKHHFLAFQDPDKVTEALSFIWGENDKWKVISQKLGLEKDICKKTLKNIVIRRNQIVHEGDYIDLFSRQEINKDDVIEIIEFIKKLGDSIYKICIKQSKNTL